MKLVIGMVGENGAGKSTYSKSIVDLIGRKDCKIIKSGDILLDTLNLWGLPSTRINMQKLAQLMEALGPNALTNAVKNRIESLKADIVIYDGVRWFSDEALIRSYPRNLLVYVTASARVRYSRLRNRNEKLGEKNLTWEQFILEDSMPTEIHISEIGGHADISIKNDNPIENLPNEINRFYKKITAVLRK